MSEISREHLQDALNYIKHCGANAVMRGEPHPQQAIVDNLERALSAEQPAKKAVAWVVRGPHGTLLHCAKLDGWQVDAVLSLPSADPRQSERRVCQLDTWGIVLNDVPFISCTDRRKPTEPEGVRALKRAAAEEPHMLSTFGHEKPTERAAQQGNQAVPTASEFSSPSSGSLPNTSGPAVAARPQGEGQK